MATLCTCKAKRHFHQPHTKKFTCTHQTQRPPLLLLLLGERQDDQRTIFDSPSERPRITLRTYQTLICKRTAIQLVHSTVQRAAPTPRRLARACLLPESGTVWPNKSQRIPVTRVPKRQKPSSRAHPRSYLVHGWRKRCCSSQPTNTLLPLSLCSMVLSIVLATPEHS